MQRGLAPIVIVLLIAAAIGGYLVYSGKINLPQKQTNQQITETSQDETSNWKTYTNNQFGFSLKYPDEWKSSGEQNGTVGSSQQTHQTSINFISNNGIILSLSLESGNPNFTDNDSYLNFINTGDPTVKSGFREIYVDNIKAILSTNLGNPPYLPGEVYSSVAAFFNKGKTYRVSVDSPKEKGDQEQLLKLILSTFKFQ